MFFSTLILVGVIGLITESIKDESPKNQLKAITKLTYGGASGLLREKGGINNVK